MVTQERLINEAAFRRLEQEINRSYTDGHFIAIAEEKIVGDSNDFKALQTALTADGRDPRKTLIVQAGYEYPKEPVCFGRWLRRDFSKGVPDENVTQ